MQSLQLKGTSPGKVTLTLAFVLASTARTASVSILDYLPYVIPSVKGGSYVKSVNSVSLSNSIFKLGCESIYLFPVHQMLKRR